LRFKDVARYIFLENESQMIRHIQNLACALVFSASFDAYVKQRIWDRLTSGVTIYQLYKRLRLTVPQGDIRGAGGLAFGPRCIPGTSSLMGTEIAFMSWVLPDAVLNFAVVHGSESLRAWLLFMDPSASSVFRSQAAG
jgi:hypothetical protein